MFLHPEIETEDSKKTQTTVITGTIDTIRIWWGKNSFTQETPPIPQSQKGSCHVHQNSCSRI